MTDSESKFHVDISRDLFERLCWVVGTKDGPWKKQPLQTAIQDAVEAALTLFLDRLKESSSVASDTQAPGAGTAFAVDLGTAAMQGLGIIFEMVNDLGEINVTYDDINYLVCQEHGAVSVGHGIGADRGIKASREALEKLGTCVSLSKLVPHVVVHIHGPKELLLRDVSDTVDTVRTALPGGTNVVFGVKTDDVRINGVRDERVTVTLFAATSDSA